MCETAAMATKSKKVVFHIEVKVKVINLGSIRKSFISGHWSMHAKYKVSFFYGSQVTEKVNVDLDRHDKTNILCNHSIRGHFNHCAHMTVQIKD